MKELLKAKSEFRKKGIKLMVVVAFLIVLEAKATTNIKVAWDFRDNSWKTLEFLGSKKNAIKIYTTAEDVTDKVFVRFVDGRNVFAIKGNK